MAEPVPGWYPDVRDPTQLRWWNGTGWGDRTRPVAGAVALAPRPPVGPPFFRLALAVQLMLGLYAVAAVGLIAADRFIADVGRQFAERPRRVSLADAERADSLILVTSLGRLVLILLVAIVFITWLYQAHRSDRMDPGRLQHKSGWAIGGWFVPILNLWRPFQMVTDVRRGASATVLTGAGLLQGAWWGVFIVSALVERVSTSLWPDDPDLSPREYGAQLAEAADLETVVLVMDIVAAVLAILLVRQVTALVRHSPYGVRADPPTDAAPPADQTSVRPS